MNDITLPYKLLIFDWDGTLMDSTARIAQTLAQALEDVRMPKRPLQERRDVIGLGLKEAMAQLCPYATDEQVEKLVERYRHHWLHPDAPVTLLFEGITESLVTLQQQGYWLAIATGKSRSGLDRSLAECGLPKELFVTSRCADETRTKPNPQMLEEILEETGLEPKDAIMLGDSIYDLQMAKYGGMHSLGVLTGVHDEDRLWQQEPLAVLESVADFPDWLLRAG